jgi:ferric-chelate reductase
MNDLWFAATILPVSRHGVWEILLDRSYDENLKYHRWLGYGAFVVTCFHFGVFNIGRLVNGEWLYKFWTEGMDLQFSKRASDCNITTGICRPCELSEVVFCQCGDGHNVFIPPLWVIFWFFAFAVGTTFVRRSKYKLFYWAHWVFVPIFSMAMFHSWHLWQYTCPGIFLWLYNRAVSRSRASTALIVMKEGTYYANGDVALKLMRKDGLPMGYSAGQFEWIQVPEIDPTDWHPFTISSSPTDQTGTASMIAPWTHHIRVTKENCFTSKLRDLVVSGKPFTVRFFRIAYSIHFLKIKYFTCILLSVFKMYVVDMSPLVAPFVHFTCYLLRFALSCEFYQT